MSTVFPYETEVKALDGTSVSLSRYRGRVLLVVNTASRCGFTRQYAGLQALHERHGPTGLSVLGFPCDQFGGQEPGDAEEIAAFCERNFGVTFDMFEKSEVIGPNRHPVFDWLHGANGAEDDYIQWNFTKFLVDRQGALQKSFAPNAAPESLETHIEALLAEDNLHDRTG